MKAWQYKGRVISLLTTQRRLPNGVKTKLEIVVHPGAVLIVPFINFNKIILIRQYRPVVQRYLYELPAGTLRAQESTIDCAQRELVEETGYRAKSFKKIGQIFPVPGYSTEVITIYEAQNLRKQTGKKDPDEMISLCLLNRRQIREFFRSGKIVDAKTICALAFCRLIP